MADIVTRAREIARLTGGEHNGPRHSPLAEQGPDVMTAEHLRLMRSASCGAAGRLG
jgi:hypothetical protein